jgi:hypothetical protein
MVPYKHFLEIKMNGVTKVNVELASSGTYVEVLFSNTTFNVFSEPFPMKTAAEIQYYLNNEHGLYVELDMVEFV